MRRAIDGLVLRELDSGENDKSLLVLTAEMGKIWIVAKGGRSIKGKKSAICHAFTYAEFEIYEKNGRYWLSGGSPNNIFFSYRPDVDGYALGAYIASICDEITAEGENEDSKTILGATLNAFYAIENELYPLEQIKAAYELFAAAISGFCPDLSACGECLKAPSDELFWFDVMNGAILCGECKAKRPTGADISETDEFNARSILLPLDQTSLAAMKYCVSAPQKRLFSFSVTNEKSARLFYRAAEAYLLNHLERGFDALSFYYKIKG